MATSTADEQLRAARRLVVIDTCSFLDVVRMPVRDQGVADANSVEWIVEASSKVPSTVTIALLDVVTNEHVRRLPGVTQSLNAELRHLDNSIRDLSARLEQMRRRCGTRPQATPVVHRPDEKWTDVVAGRTIDLGTRVLSAAVPCSTTDDDLKLAYERVMTARPPAERGAASMSDSIVCEAALRLARARPVRSTALLTSNDKDFRRGGNLHPDLRADFEDSGLVDARSWADVVSFTQAEATR